ncbi:aldehyde dehydrogenase family protein, partial [Staphylococcus epidermidis]|uniref:aldehyde dehydrogenase family protein n=1 Tax=Staphylococcus epidermidis TaxID=1282 RepID=UPI0030BB1B09
MRNYTQQYINGEWIDSESNETIDVINPATEEVIGKVSKGNEKDVEKAVQAAHDVYLEFRHSSVEERKQLLDRIVEE